MKVLIGGAWPYANGSLHIGHVAALLPGDVLARYYRAKGEDVLYVSGSDCHGTPITIRAKNEGVSPKDIADRYHEEFKHCFDKLKFSYDFYGRTDDDFHKREVRKAIHSLYEKGFIYEKEVEQIFCSHCNQFLPDRYVEGLCPKCGCIARGDQCDHCGTLLEPLELTQRTCKLCGNEPEVRTARQLYFSLSKFDAPLREKLEKSRKQWRLNAVNNTERYLNEGLQDRAISRDLSHGIDIPIKGYEDKKVYVWIDAVLGYLTTSKQLRPDFKVFWQEDALSYYVHGKDNIPFHTIILPALLHGLGYSKLPDNIISSEYLTLEGRKISTSNQWAVWIPDVIERYNVDALRYFFLINAPEKRDTDFSWKEFINSNNGELLGAYGNLVNRTLVFIQKYYKNTLPEGKIDKNIHAAICELYPSVGQSIEKGNLKIALEDIFEFIRSVNKYFDSTAPWITVNSDQDACKATISSCVHAIVNLSNLLHPFLPESSEKIKIWLGVQEFCWKAISPVSGTELGEIEVLFERLDKKLADEERRHLEEYLR